ncbi:MAG: cupin domain-containing protein [Desulfobacterales bacterium]|nr:cupin domain-containing protein [Desulfobacterales bacterium]
MRCDASVTRWAQLEPPRAEKLNTLLADEGLSAYRWSNRPGNHYPAHTHAFHKVIYVVAGSITFRLPGCDGNVRLEAGDRLDLPAGVRHDAEVGAQGVVCLEAHRER